MWVVEAVVEAVGQNGNGTYTYLVDAPEDTNPMDVACCAYAQHGRLVRMGSVTDWLGPVHSVYWQEVTQWEKV